MNDDTPSSEPASKGWLERLSQAFSDQPEDLSDLLEILRDSEQRNVIDTDSLSIIEGAMQVTHMQAR